MSGKRKQLSVIIAGATGSTGRQLVSRLVSHPDVSRVVALARHPIPVNRWSSVFPHLHTGDALRYLSVVPVDWMRILADASNIPPSYVSNCVWRPEDEAKERGRFFHQLRHKEALGTATGAGDDPAHRLSTVASPVGVRALGYVKYVPCGAVDICLDASRAAAAVAGVSSPGTDTATAHEDSLLAQMHDSQAFLQAMLHHPFYKSVFSGHHVAINCIGTSSMLSSSQVLMVDYELSMAFGKVVRLFNCMTHTESTDDEERLLVESISKELDSVLWAEINSACYGKHSSAKPSANPVGDVSFSASGGPLNDEDALGRLPPLQEHPHLAAGDADGLRVATLRHFSQMSVRSASDHSIVPYLRAHGRRDRDLLQLFNRFNTQYNSHGLLRTLFLPSFQLPWAAPFPPRRTGSLLKHGWGGRPAGSVATPTPPPFRVAASGDTARAGFGTAAHTPHRWWGRPTWRIVQQFLYGSGSVGDAAPTDTPLTVEDDNDALARRQAELLLSRDVIKVWETAALTIWRPGVLRRPKMRMTEWFLSLFERPVDVRVLAECIVDDIIESVYKERGPGDVGTVKIIGGKSVGRRVYMKTMEDSLDQRDSGVTEVRPGGER